MTRFRRRVKKIERYLAIVREIVNSFPDRGAAGNDGAIDRLNPPVYHSRFYHLRELRKGLTAVINQIDRLESVDTILDYGCGSSPYESLFRGKCKTYLKADLKGVPGADVTIHEQGTVEYASDSVDLVLSTQVLEHVVDPAKMLAESYRLLKPGGHLILSTHGNWIYHPDPTDYWRWTCDGLRKIVEEAGFTIVAMDGIMGLGAMGLQYVYDTTQERIWELIRPLVSTVFQGMMWILDSGQNSNQKRKDASVFIVLAQKKIIRPYPSSEKYAILPSV